MINDAFGVGVAAAALSARTSHAAPCPCRRAGGRG